MKTLLLILALVFSPPLFSGELRSLAFETLPQELQALRTKQDAQKAFQKLPDIKKKWDKDIYRVNYLGLNYDLSLGLAGDKLDWLTLKTPLDWPASKGLYQKISMLLTPAQVKETEKRFLAQAGHRARTYMDIDFDGVIYRFHFETKTLESLTIKDYGRGKGFCSSLSF